MLRDLDQSRQQIVTRRSEIEQRVRRFYRSVGWLTRDIHHQWQLSYAVSLPSKDKLMVAVPGAENASGVWRIVGEITENQPTVRSSDQSALVEGRPVFVEFLW